MEIPIISVFDMLPFVVLQNAVKYTPPGYNINVEFDEVANSNLHIKVSSYGPVVEEQELPNIFDREFRGKHSRHIEGQGLGLHLAKKFATSITPQYKQALATHLNTQLTVENTRSLLSTFDSQDNISRAHSRLCCISSQEMPGSQAR